jgi:hypothetical protein
MRKQLVAFRLEAEEVTELRKEAIGVGSTLSQYVRWVLLQRAKRKVDNGKRRKPGVRPTNSH